MRRARPLPPHLVAQTDQDTALLADLVACARRHHRYCARPASCAGDAAEALLDQANPEALWRVLQMAVAELARHGYGEPIDVHLVDPRPGHPRGKADGDG